MLRGFVIILIFSNIINCNELWNQFEKILDELKSKTNTCKYNIPQAYDNVCRNNVLTRVTTTENNTLACDLIWETACCAKIYGRECSQFSKLVNQTIDQFLGYKEIASCRQRTRNNNQCKENLEFDDKCNPYTLGLSDFFRKLKASSCGEIIESNIKECLGSDSNNYCCVYWKMTDCFNDESKTNCKILKKEFDDIVNNWKECGEIRKCSQFSDRSKQCNNSFWKLSIGFCTFIFSFLFYLLYILRFY